MATIRVDFSACRTAKDFHSLLREKLRLPDYYGMNLDALWDCLTGQIELPLLLEISGMDALTADAQAQAQRILRLFEEAQKKDIGFAFQVITGRDLLENNVPALHQNRKHVFLHPNSGIRILFVGNSYTKHAPKPDIGWYRDNGMEASCPEKDYVHLIMQKIREQYDPHAAFGIAQVAAYARNLFTEKPEEHYQEAADFDPDLILMFFGENVPKEYHGMKNPPVCFADAYEAMRNFLNPKGRARVLHVQGFAPHLDLDAEKRQVAEKYGETFIPLEDIRVKPELRGSFNHPNDQGMREIADRFWEYIEPEIRQLTSPQK